MRRYFCLFIIIMLICLAVLFGIGFGIRIFYYLEAKAETKVIFKMPVVEELPKKPEKINIRSLKTLF